MFFLPNFIPKLQQKPIPQQNIFSQVSGPINTFR